MEIEQNTENPQSQLKKRLLSGELSPDAFLEEIFRLDQSTSTRLDSYLNLEILTDTNLECLFMGDLRSEYLNLLCLTYFHIGQLEAMSGPNSPLSYFEFALEVSKGVDWEDYDDWKLYVASTISYFKQDLSALEKNYNLMKDGRNREIVSNFIQGIKTRGGINYNEDYSR